MAKPKQIRETSNDLGKKINLVMAEKNMDGDYAKLAQEFGISTPSTYSWIDKGTISKDHYAALAKWSGKSLDWWFDAPKLSTHHHTSEAARENVVDYELPWPFTKSRREIMALSEIDRARIDGYITATVDASQRQAWQTTAQAQG